MVLGSSLRTVMYNGVMVFLRQEAGTIIDFVDNKSVIAVAIREY